MRSHRSSCARAGLLLLAGAILAGAPSTVHARSAFNSGVTSAIDQIVNLIETDAGQNAPRGDMRHLRTALNQLLDVLQGAGNQGQRGHMGKGMSMHRHHHHHHHHAKGIGVAAGNKNAGQPCAKGMAGNARQGVGNMPGNNNLIGKAMAKKGQTAGVAKNGAALKAGNVRQGNANAANAGAVKKANSPHANNPGNVLAARAVGGNLTRPVTSGKPGAPLAFNHVAKGNSGVNPARAMPTAAKKNVNSANAMTRLAVGHHFAGASVGHRAMPHAAALRRK